VDLTLLRYFRAVYRCGSVREASNELHVAPSAVSRQILKLEDSLGAPLFERWARGVRPTEAGEIFASFVRNTLLDLDRVRNELDALRGLERGHVRILSTEGLVADFLLQTIDQFGRTYPGIRFDLTLTGTDLVTDGILRGNADVGIAFNAEANPQLDFTIRIVDPLAAVMHPDHPLAKKRQLSLSDIKDYHVAVPAPTFGIRRLIDEECKAAKVTLDVAMQTNSIEALRGYARTGAGVTFLPSLAIRSNLDSGALVSVPLKETSFRRTTHDICVLAGRSLPPAVTAFVDELRKTGERMSALAGGQRVRADKMR
jgi:DNA-binding transcriptional LysR family regulator